MKILIEEVYNFLEKWWVYLLYILIGIIGKFAYDMITKRKLSIWQALGSVGIAGVTGYFACVWCMINAPEKAPYMVPLATLLSEKFFNWIFSLDWKVLFQTLLQSK